jgi:hypothetical protein
MQACDASRATPARARAQAEKTAALFVKETELAAAIGQLQDMQHMWYECGTGEAHLRRREWGKVGPLGC